MGNAYCGRAFCTLPLLPGRPGVKACMAAKGTFLCCMGARALPARVSYLQLGEDIWMTCFPSLWARRARTAQITRSRHLLRQEVRVVGPVFRLQAASSPEAGSGGMRHQLWGLRRVQPVPLCTCKRHWCSHQWHQTGLLRLA